MSSARETAIVYLSRFSRTEQQVRDYLIRKEFPADEIADAIFYLRSKKYVNDSAFTESFIQSRILRGDGPRKIRHMLLHKGIDSETRDRLLRELYPEELQVEVAAQLLGKRPRIAADRRRASRLLASRGFPRYVMIQALKTYTEEKES